MSAVATLPARLTYEEYLSLPDDGNRYELIEGKLFVFATPTPEHQLALLELAVLFREAITLKGLGRVMPAPVEVKFPRDNAVEPNLVVVLRDRAHIVGGKRIEGVPNALLEILSPTNRQHDLKTKFALYARQGVPEYWIVDLDVETITVHELRDGVYHPLPTDRGIARSRVVPDLAVDVAALFKTVRAQSF